MQVELTPTELELLIAVLKHADDTFVGPIALALRDLRTARSAMLQAYLRGRAASGRALNGAPTPDEAPSAGEQETADAI